MLLIYDQLSAAFQSCFLRHIYIYIYIYASLKRQLHKHHPPKVIEKQLAENHGIHDELVRKSYTEAHGSFFANFWESLLFVSVLTSAVCIAKIFRNVYAD